MSKTPQADKRRKRQNGYTLIEAAVALALWLILAAGAGSALLYSARASERLVGSQEAFENARAALDAIITNIQLAETVRVETDSDGVLKKLTCTERNGPALHDYEFFFKREALPGEAKYHRLEFGLNDEFASHIESITVEYAGGDRITVGITTDQTFGEPYTLTGSADVRYKKVIAQVKVGT
ncbi:MAG: prepilin-type N-terminal cleavage/methylation domain-containing protein [Defluviitaleaceae bacterium]|nr:prepilin-type N-terminal cleavage/methylation domain-containing protein [Defluviitaleaceae bacterium]